jgi:hypothetical protein
MILQIRGVKYQPRSKSASRTHLKYSKESTNIVGSLRMKPTVSESKKVVLITTSNSGVSNVANNLFSTKHHLFPYGIHQSRFSNICITNERYTNHRTTVPRCVPICLSIALILSFNKAILSRTIRRSVSLSQVHAHSSFWRKVCPQSR